MLHRIMILISGSAGLLLLLAAWSAMTAQARSQHPAFIIPEVEDLSLVNQIGGGVFATAIQGNYAYVGMGPRLLVMDVQNPAQPLLLGQTDVLSGLVSQIQVVGNYAYLGLGEGVSIVDVSDAGAPAQVSFYDSPRPVHGFAVSDTLVYMAEQSVWVGSQFEGGGLRIINVSDPANPTQIGHLETNETSYGVSVSGNYAYLHNNSGPIGFRVIDVTNPVLPNEVNFVNTFYGPQSSVISDSYLYIAMGEGGLEIYDLTNPQNPTGVTSYDTPGESSAVYVNNNRAYLADLWSMIILDITTPSLPTFLGVYDLGTPAVYEVSADGDYAYVAYGYQGLRVLSVADPVTPTEVAVYGLFGNPYGIEIKGNYAYLLDRMDGFLVLDLTNGMNPIAVGSYSPLGANDFEVIGNFAYLASGTNLVILDITDPTSPTLASQHPVSGTAREVAIAENYAYIAAYPTGLQVVDISEPYMPMNTSLLGLPDGVGHVATANGFAYAADMYGNNVYIIDVSSPMTPTLAATYPVTNEVYGIDAVGNYVYLAQNVLGLHVIDVTTPTLPTMASTYPLGWYTDNGDIEVADGRAYLASFINGVAMFDVSDPTTPVLIDSYNSSGFALDVAVTGVYVYVADAPGGLLILGGSDLPLLSVNDAAVVEGDAGTAVLTFTVTLNSSDALTQTVLVDYATADGSATAHEDYHPISGTLTFTPGETTEAIPVLVVGDTAVEPNETFFLNLSNPVNAILINTQAVGTIVDDDVETQGYQLYLPVILKP